MARTGRPKRTIEIEQLKALCRLKPTLLDCAAFFEVSDRTIERIIAKYNGMTFVEFREQNMVHTRHTLIRKALDMAMSGNTAMMIFSLKNLCGWADKTELSTPENLRIQLAYKIE